MQFECECCYETQPTGARLVCPACQYSACAACVKRCPTPGTCLQCKYAFQGVEMVEPLGMAYIKQVVRKHRMDWVIDRERAAIPQTQPLVAWEKLRRESVQSLRFRVAPQVPPPPETNAVLDSSGFQCPADRCRGYVFVGREPICGTCSKRSCQHCRELSADGHVCSPGAAESIKAIASETKPCPKCKAAIYRAYGCNHMYCTACSTYFDWVTGEIHQKNSNTHYVPAGATTDQVQLSSGVSASIDAIKYCVLTCASPVTRQMLLDVQPALFVFVQSEANDTAVEIINGAEMVRLRVLYLLGEKTQKQWETAIVRLETKRLAITQVALVVRGFIAKLNCLRDAAFLHYVHTHPAGRDILKREQKAARRNIAAAEARRLKEAEAAAEQIRVSEFLNDVVENYRPSSRYSQEALRAIGERAKASASTAMAAPPRLAACSAAQSTADAPLTGARLAAREPSTSASSTSASSTSAPSTSEPSTSAPSTSAPSTSAPSTSTPSTSAPSTSAPSTSALSTTNASTQPAFVVNSEEDIQAKYAEIVDKANRDLVAIALENGSPVWHIRSDFSTEGMPFVVRRRASGK